VTQRSRAHVFISGMVQGVSFRWYTVQEARARGVGGWVRNLPDGRVEAVFEGDEGDVSALVAWCEHGPRHARVTKVDVGRDEEPEGLYEFDVDV
jgi:acylphosphatase